MAQPGSKAYKRKEDKEKNREREGGKRGESWQFQVHLYRALWELGTEVRNKI